MSGPKHPIYGEPCKPEPVIIDDVPFYTYRVGVRHPPNGDPVDIFALFTEDFRVKVKRRDYKTTFRVTVDGNEDQTSYRSEAKALKVGVATRRRKGDSR